MNPPEAGRPAHFRVGTDAPAGLEGLAHLRDKVCALWGGPEMEDFVRELMLDSREGKRKGLPTAIVSDLVFLAEVNRTLRALRRAEQLGVAYDKARKSIESEDHRRVALDAFDDPLVSRDTVVDAREMKARGTAPAARPASRRRPASESEGLLPILLRWLLNRYVIGIMVLLLAAFHYWPAIRAYLSTSRGLAVESQPSRDGGRSRAEPATTSTE